MDDERRLRARQLVVKGFLITALGFFILLVRALVLNHSVGWLWSLDTINDLAVSLSWAAAALAFWWLCQVKFMPQQASLMSKAFYGLALQASLTAIVLLSEVIFAFSVGYVEWWYTATEIVSAAGVLLTISGFVMLARDLTPVGVVAHVTQ
jgi:hypothetical protein